MEGHGYQSLRARAAPGGHGQKPAQQAGVGQPGVELEVENQTVGGRAVEQGGQGVVEVRRASLAVAAQGAGRRAFGQRQGAAGTAGTGCGQGFQAVRAQIQARRASLAAKGAQGRKKSIQ